MGKSNTYRAPFLDGNWIVDTLNTISVKHFQVKPISEMFEMLLLQINLLFLTISDAMVFLSFNKLLLCYLFPFYIHEWSSPTQRILHIIFGITYSRIFWGNLRREFGARIWRRNLLWKLAMAICRVFFVSVSKFFLAYVVKSFLHGTKPFSFLLVRFYLLTVFSFCCRRGSYEPPHRK